MNAKRMLAGAALAAAASLGLAMSAAAAPIMPSFAGAPGLAPLPRTVIGLGLKPDLELG